MWYVVGTLVFTIYGQLILKWRLNILGEMPIHLIDKIKFLLKAFLDPFILSGFFSAFIASIFWMGAMTKYEITTVYPFMSLAPSIVFIFGILLFNETFTLGKIIGLVLIIIGIILTVKL